MTPSACLGSTRLMGSVLRRVERRARGEDPSDAREELMHRIAALMNAHRVKRLGDDAVLIGGLLELAALLAVTSAVGEADFKVQAINAHVEATRQQTEEDEEDGDDE